jgi:hypothetical protein
MANIFISYSRRDGAYANQLRAALDQLNIHGFLDQLDIAAGASWDRKIRDSILEADAVLVIVSENSIQSNYVLAELGMAWSYEKLIIPVIPKGAKVKMADIPPILRDIQLLDVRDQSVDEVAGAIYKILSK